MDDSEQQQRGYSMWMYREKSDQLFPKLPGTFALRPRDTCRVLAPAHMLLAPEPIAVAVAEPRGDRSAPVTVASASWMPSVLALGATLGALFVGAAALARNRGTARESEPLKE